MTEYQSGQWVLSCYHLTIPTPFSPTHSSLEKTTGLQPEQVWWCKPATRRLATAGGQCRFGAQRTVFLWPVWKLPGKAPLAAVVIVWPDSELTQSKQPSPHGVYWKKKKKISVKCLILQLPWVSMLVRQTRGWKRLTIKICGMICLWEPWKVMIYSWVSRRPHTCAGLCACPGKTQEGGYVSLWANREALHKNEAKAKAVRNF